MLIIEIPSEYEVYRFGPFLSYQDAIDWYESKGLSDCNPCLVHVEDIEGPNAEKYIEDVKFVTKDYMTKMRKMKE